MNLFHFRYRRRLGLLADSSLPPGEADALLRHVGECAACSAEMVELTRMADLLKRDAAQDRPLPISSEALRTRVLAEARDAARRAEGARVASPSLALAALSFVAIGLLSGVVATRFAPSSISPAPAVVQNLGPSETLVNDTAFYERLEKTQLRANAVRYLAEAQDVLIQVTAAAIDCPDSPQASEDVTHEPRTSRSLLDRRAALVSGSRGTLIAARGVMEEVEGVLQEVADLPRCTRRTDVNAIARRVDGRKLLMKIDLVTQELAAP